MFQHMHARLNANYVFAVLRGLVKPTLGLVYDCRLNLQILVNWEWAGEHISMMSNSVWQDVSNVIHVRLFFRAIVILLICYN